MAFVPSGQVLANGSYLVYASLNGGCDWSSGPDNTDMVRLATVQGCNQRHVGSSATRVVISCSAGSCR